MANEQPDQPQVSLDDIEQLLHQIMGIGKAWVALVVVAAILSAVSITFRNGVLEGSVQITAITVLLIGLVWLPAVVRAFALAGGSMKTPAGEATLGGLVGVLKSLDPAAKRGAVTAVIAALDTDPSKNDPKVERLRAQLQGELANVPVDSQAAKQRLGTLAREYDVVRAEMPPGPERTFQMTQIVTEARGLARAVDLDPGSITALMEGSGGGERIVALALIQAKPNAAYLPKVIDCIENGRTPFEQYQALLAAMALVPFLGSSERMELRATVESRQGRGAEGVVIDERDPDRLNLAGRLLKALGPPLLESAETSARN